MSLGIFQTPSPKNEPVLAYAPGSPERRTLEGALRDLSSQVEEIPLCLGSEHRMSKGHDPVTTPHDHQRLIARVAQADAAAIDTACAQTLSAQKEWQSLAWEQRAAIFLKAADLLSGKWRATMNAATMLGQSKTCFQAEIDAACELADFWRFNVHYARQILEQQPESAAGMWNRSEVRGLEGFVLAISPFNFTSIALNLPTAPALMGSTVVWKPAHTSMLSSWIGMKILEEAGLPPGVITMLAGDAVTIGQRLLARPELAGIHFTGSTKTFQHLWRAVGSNIDRYHTYPRLVGETGGKDFVFAHPSADGPSLVTALVRGAFEFQGQKCSAASRAYIPQSLWSKIKEPLLAQTRELKVGDPTDFSNFMGAVIDAKAYERIKGYIDHAKSAEADARILVGGECDAKQGYFVRPTIIEAKNPRYRSMVEEIFGPVLSVYVYQDQALEQTLELCDQSTPYALTGAIFARDRLAIAKMSEALRNAAGNFYINDKPTGAVVGQQPFGGARASGTNDKAGSPLNLWRWANLRTIKETFVPPDSYRYPHMG